MALKLQLRHGDSSNWTSVNPILSAAELGIELDTGRFKAGDGTTSWNSLTYTDIQGATQVGTYKSFGDGSDGDITISSGTTVLTQDVYYNNLTLTGTGKINCNGYKIFIKGLLDISNAGVGAIQANGENGNNGVGSVGGTSGTATVIGTMGIQGVGTTGSTGTTGNGTASSGVTQITGNGGTGNSSGSGGGGSGTTGGNGGNGQVPLSTIVRTYFTNFLRGIVVIGGGGGGRGGGAGGGDGVNSGGGGGGGGVGGGSVVIYANNILTATTTPSSTIQANGGDGGNGGTPSTGDCGGGGGGGGAGGGWVYLCYNHKSGPIVSFISANGGKGGNGGDGIGIGLGGGGSQGGGAGSIIIIEVPTNNTYIYNPVTDNLFIPETTIPFTASVVTGGRSGGIGGKREASL